MTVPQRAASKSDVMVSDLTRAIENFNRYYIRLPVVHQLSFTTLSVLDTLNLSGPKRLTELVRTEQISQPGLTQLVTRLERDGLVERRPDPADGRAVLVHITDNGRMVGQARHEDRGRHLMPLIAQLTPAERQTLAGALPVLNRLAELGAEAGRQGPPLP
ncbi:MarR family transcriptional regulator [Streptomyces sp. CA-278952]|uniref:MarR family winged helix-turn-helix transcriptional regulator n=1 Tax=unclassified Streptomyces TaxID=2593676 RepID=UPI002242A094|nr:MULTISPECIES: MarR family transcriptional regulator [unclassified Streptomyces]UZI31434.1 MarR family transcriptional regulator [Streptomyces sp. VB1]WDG31476.1 MarR family transcriptional regulator [Streptomyces sp. CA-278952]